VCYLILPSILVFCRPACPSGGGQYLASTVAVEPCVGGGGGVLSGDVVGQSDGDCSSVILKLDIPDGGCLRPSRPPLPTPRTSPPSRCLLTSHSWNVGDLRRSTDPRPIEPPGLLLSASFEPSRSALVTDRSRHAATYAQTQINTLGFFSAS